MLFYYIDDGHTSPQVELTLGAAHKTAKTYFDRDTVSINEVDIATDKPSLLQLVRAAMRTAGAEDGRSLGTFRRKWYLGPRGGLESAENEE